MVAPWIETTDIGLGHVTDLWATAERNGVHVLSGQPAADGWAAQLWYSTDGTRWQSAAMPAPPQIDRIHAIASTSTGFAALGLDFSGDDTLTHALVSGDGRAWHLAGSYTGMGTYLAEIDGRLLAFGNVWWLSDPWYSDDGAATWEKLDTDSGLAVANGLLALHQADGYLWAVRSDNPIEDASIRTPVELWRTSDGLEWQLVSELPQSISANQAAMAHGPTGWVITTRRTTFPEPYEQTRDWYAWYSSDGEIWKAATFGPRYVDQIVADEQGFIGVGGDPGPCCALDDANVRQWIWSSTAGKTWHAMPRKGWHGREIDFITTFGDHVAGVGMDWLLPPGPDGEAWGVAWEVDRAELQP